MTVHDLNVLSSSQMNFRRFEIKAMGGGSRKHITLQCSNDLGKFTPAEKSLRRNMIALFKYSPRKDMKKKTHSVPSLKHNLDKWVIEEGVHASTI